VSNRWPFLNILMLTFASFLVEHATIDYASYNLAHKFAYFNQHLFDNKIPECPIKWDNGLKKAAGTTYYKMQGRKYIPGSMSISICDRFKRTEQSLDGIVIHEMIHAFLTTNGHPDHGHGFLFRAKVMDLSHKAGFQIPLSDDIGELDLVDNETTVSTVVMVYIKDTYYAAFLGGSAYDAPAKLNALEVEVNRASHLKTAPEILVYKTDTNLVRKYGQVRTLKKLQGISSSEAQGIIQHGKLIRKIVPGTADSDFLSAHEVKSDVLLYSVRRTDRPDQIKVSAYSTSIVKDRVKFHKLMTYRQGYFERADPANYDAKLFVAKTAIPDRRRWKLARDPLALGYYPVSDTEYHELLKGATILWQFGG